MSKDRMNFDDLPKPPGKNPLQQFIFTGKMAEGSSLNQAAKLIRENTNSPITLVFNIGPNGTEIGGASGTHIPKEVVIELITRITTAMHGYLSEPANLLPQEPEDDSEENPQEKI